MDAELTINSDNSSRIAELRAEDENVYAFQKKDNNINVTTIYDNNTEETNYQDEKASQAVNQDYKTRTSTLDSLQSKRQVPQNGPFDRTDLTWEMKTNNGRGRQRTTYVAFFPWDRLDDFVEGESNMRDFPCTFNEHSILGSSLGQARNPKTSTYIRKISYWCEYGPEDISGAPDKDVDKLFANALKKRLSTSQKKAVRKAQKDATKTARASALRKTTTSKKNIQVPDLLSQIPDPNLQTMSTTGLDQDIDCKVLPKKSKRLGKKQLGLSIKRGCQCNWTAKQLYLDPTLCEIQYHSFLHQNLDGVFCHGSTFGGFRHSLGAHLSSQTKAWIRAALGRGLSPSQVMAEHKREVLELAKSNQLATRDTFIMPADVYNIAQKRACELWQKHSKDALSVRIWVEENPDSIFYYQEFGVLDINMVMLEEEAPFCLAIQTGWQLDMMIRHGHNRAISMDSTFGTNEQKYPLYTVMVFDEWENAIPVAFIIVGRSREGDILPWLQKLNARCIKMMPKWRPNAIIVDNAQAELNAISKVWPTSQIFLCLWHVRKAWMENAVQKIKDENVRVEVLSAVANIMYSTDLVFGREAVDRAKVKICNLKDIFPTASTFITYFLETWLSKTAMWVSANRMVPHANQDTNAAIESYHNNLKMILASSRQKLQGRRMDWLIYYLVGDVLTHYWYGVQCKLYGFVKNKKAEGIVASAVLRAREIPDNYVTMFPNGLDVAFVLSINNFPHVWTVTSPNSPWAQCTCPVHMQGNLCKHVVKVLKLVCPTIQDAAMVREVGTLHGTYQGGASSSGLALHSSSFRQDDNSAEVQEEKTGEATEDAVNERTNLLHKINGVLSEIQDLVNKDSNIHETALAYLMESRGKLIDRQAKTAAGILHFSSQPTFDIGSCDNNIKRHKSFLERSHHSRK